MRYSVKWPEYARQWDAMKINPERVKEFDRLAQFAVTNKTKYLEVAAKSNTWWAHIAILHRRESDADFNTYLGNGDPLSRKTTNVPKGRGPFDTFLAGALDALHLDGLDSVRDWNIEKVLYYCEIFNGTGYDRHGLPSPYIWGGTNIQKPGKYTADGVWNSRVMDSQPGCAPLIATIAKLDPSVSIIRET